MIFALLMTAEKPRIGVKKTMHGQEAKVNGLAFAAQPFGYSVTAPSTNKVCNCLPSPSQAEAWTRAIKGIGTTNAGI